MATKMRQSLADFERQFVAEIRQDRVRRESVQREAVVRSRRREIERVHKHGTARFIALVVALIVTAIVVTVVMFKTLYVVMG